MLIRSPKGQRVLCMASLSTHRPRCIPSIGPKLLPQSQNHHKQKTPTTSPWADCPQSRWACFAKPTVRKPNQQDYPFVIRPWVNGILANSFARKKPRERSIWRRCGSHEFASWQTARLPSLSQLRKCTATVATRKHPKVPKSKQAH